MVDTSKLELNQKDYLKLLGDIMSNVKNLQNHPSGGLIPQEKLVVDLIKEFLKEYLGDDTSLSMEEFEWKDGRTNVILKYSANDDEVKDKKDIKCMSFVGSHMDVVPANPEEWDFDPFKLSVDGDKLMGRGVTDCLGHVALLTCLFRDLAKNKVKSKRDIYCVLIASEENTELGEIGAEKLLEHGKLEPLKNGPLFWVDSADFGPTLATGGVVAWELKAIGKKFHSGLPHKAVNSIELATNALQEIQDAFYKDFPKHKLEEKYNFNTSSSMKATRIAVPPGGINQIPGSCTIKGDIRFVPFYKFSDIRKKVEGYVKDLEISKIKTAYPTSKYELKDEGVKGQVKFSWIGEEHAGVACNLDSEGYKAILSATKAVRGKASPFSLTGSLPVIADLQKAGFDVQVTGYGSMSAYHAINEYASLKDYSDGYAITSNVIGQLC